MYGQLCAFVFALVSCTSVITTTFWSQWAMSSPQSATKLGPIWLWKGIWADCIQYYGGQYNCEEQQSLFLERTTTNVIRGMMCLAMAMSVFGTFTILVGMECSKVLEENLRLKRKLMRASGAMHIIAGLLTLASVSWYASMLHYDFFSVTNQDNMIRYEFGAALYVGFVCSIVSVVTGLLCICMPGPQPEKDHYHSSVYPYTRATSTRHSRKISDKQQVHSPTKDKYMDYV